MPPETMTDEELQRLWSLSAPDPEDEDSLGAAHGILRGILLGALAWGVMLSGGRAPARAAMSELSLYLSAAAQVGLMLGSVLVIVIALEVFIRAGQRSE